MTNTPNTYFAVRHGQAEHNVLGVIASARPACDHRFGLTKYGKESVEASLLKAIDTEVLTPEKPTLVVASPLLRTVQTAEQIIKTAAQRALNVLQEEIDIRDAWTERDFGNLEGRRNINYQRIWMRDEMDSTHTYLDVESADAVRQRIEQDIAELNEKYHNLQILLCSHGDTLNIAETYFKDRPASEHRRYEPIKTAEIRKLN